MWNTRSVVSTRRALVLVALILIFAAPRSLWAQAQLENPAPGSFQSGIGVISGWKCTAGTITITVDNGPPSQAAYGTSREDTRPVCGKANTGFGLLFNWNLLGNGQRTLRAFDNGVQFASATFTVTTLGQEFLRGASGTFTLQNFPQTGKNVTVQWAESAQNFVITGASGGGSGPFSGTYKFSTTKTSDTCGISQTGLTDTLTVTQDGSNLTGTIPSVPGGQFSGTVDASGNFTLTQTNPTQTTSGSCTFEVGVSLSGNFNSGSLAVTLSRRPVSGSCPSNVNCDVSFSGTLTKTSSAQQETSEDTLFGEGEGPSVDELIDSLFDVSKTPPKD